MAHLFSLVTMGKEQNWHAVPVLPEKQDAYIPDTCNNFRRRTLLVLGIHV